MATMGPLAIFLLVVGVALMAVPSARAGKCGTTATFRDAGSITVSSEAEWTAFKTNYAKDTNGNNCDEIGGALTMTAWSTTTAINFPTYVKKFLSRFQLIASSPNVVTADFPAVESTKILEILVCTHA